MSAFPPNAHNPVVLDRHVLTLDVAGFVEAFAERGHIACVGIGRTYADKPDHRHRRLLRVRSERRRNGSAAERGYEVPSSDVDWH